MWWLVTRDHKTVIQGRAATAGIPMQRLWFVPCRFSSLSLNTPRAEVSCFFLHESPSLPAGYERNQSPLLSPIPFRSVEATAWAGARVHRFHSFTGATSTDISWRTARLSCHTSELFAACVCKPGGQWYLINAGLGSLRVYPTEFSLMD